MSVAVVERKTFILNANQAEALKKVLAKKLTRILATMHENLRDKYRAFNMYSDYVYYASPYTALNNNVVPLSRGADIIEYRVDKASSSYSKFNSWLQVIDTARILELYLVDVSVKEGTIYLEQPFSAQATLCLGKVISGYSVEDSIKRILS